jgi:hypothetical protein
MDPRAEVGDLVRLLRAKPASIQHFLSRQERPLPIKLLALLDKTSLSK